MTADPVLLAKEVGSLVGRLRLWTPQRWAAAADPWGTRADLARHLAQWWADRAAELEGEPQRELPRLTPDLLVVDQLAVTGDDLVRAVTVDQQVRAVPTLELCEQAVAHLLAHRLDLLGDDPPASLGGVEALRLGREVCGREGRPEPEER